MNVHRPLALLGGLTPQAFMREYWQCKPLLIRQAIPGFRPGLSMADIRQLARRSEVESRLIRRDGGQWALSSGPFSRLPSARTPNWTLLAQSVDLHDDSTAELMHRFRFISDARLDDAMISIASDGGGVGPHFDSYDVFLLQGHGRRRWKIGSQKDLTLKPGLPLKILDDFRPEHDYVLEPGDMLYLPPHIAHEGIAVGPCMTISIGFRAPDFGSLAQGLLAAAIDRIAAQGDDPDADEAGQESLLAGRYSDANSGASATPARLPDTLIKATLDAVAAIRFDDHLASRFLGQWLTELSPNAYFLPADEPLALNDCLPTDGALVLDRCTRLMYRGRQLFINGELADVAPSTATRKLANSRRLDCSPANMKRLSGQERVVLTDWLHQGWLHYQTN